MEQDGQVYTRLQRHLDRQAVGFTATRSGVEIKLLKHIFTPEEAGKKRWGSSLSKSLPR